MIGDVTRSAVVGPEPPPPGWHIDPPDFVGVGAPGSRAAWWDALVHAHPKVARRPGRPAAFHFFEGAWSVDLGDAETARYRALFPRPDGSIAGEWSPEYMVDFWVPPLLHRAAPAARLLVLLRDPVERFSSGPDPLERAPSAPWTARAKAGASFQAGLYADQLLRLWAAFPGHQVFVLQYERCMRDPRAELRRTFEFLGLDAAPADSIDIERVTGGAVPPASGDWPLNEDQRRTLARGYAPENRRLAALLPDLDLSLWTAA